MGNVCGCGEKEKVDFREKERIKALVAQPETGKVLQQIDMVKHDFKKVDEKNANGYFDAFYEVLGSRSRPPQDKLHTLMLLNQALENNPKTAALLKRHPIYPLLNKEIATRKAAGATFHFDKSRPASWQDNYHHAILELMENAATKQPGALPEFDRFYQENQGLFPRHTNLLNLNSGSLDAERDRLLSLQRGLQAARERAIEEVMDRARNHGDLRTPGTNTVMYGDAIMAADLNGEDWNRLHILGLAPELSGLQKEVEFHEQLADLTSRAGQNDPAAFENALRNLVSAYYPNMTDLIDKNSVISGPNSVPKRPAFREEDLDKEYISEIPRENPLRRSNPDDYDYDLDRSPSPTPQPDPRQIREEQKRQILHENSELKTSVSALRQEKQKIEASIRHQSQIGRSAIGRSLINQDGLNMTTTRNFNMKSFTQSTSSADLLRVLNDKEVQIENLRKNLERLQLTYSQIYDDNETERTLRETDVERDAQSYTSMLLQKDRQRSLSVLAQSALKERIGGTDRGLRESAWGDPRGYSDYKRSYVI
jgi:hypothetical protein